MTTIKQSMESQIQLVTTIFLKYIAKIHNLIGTLPTTVENIDGYSFVLLNVYQSMIMQDFPAVEMLAEKNLYIAAAKITRSMLEATNIILYLYKLEPAERELAAKSFAEFQGQGNLNQKNKYTFDWLKTISDISIREMLISHSLDKEIASFGFINIDGKDIPLTGYDFLSRITHYNPITFKKRGNKILSYPPDNN